MSNLVVNFKQETQYTVPISFNIRVYELPAFSATMDVVIRNQVNINEDDPDLSFLVWKGTIPMSVASGSTTHIHGTLRAPIAGYIIDRPASSSLALLMFFTPKNFVIADNMSIQSASGENYFAPENAMANAENKPLYSGKWVVRLKRDNLSSPNYATLFNIVPPIINIRNGALGYITLSEIASSGTAAAAITVGIGQTASWDIINSRGGTGAAIAQNIIVKVTPQYDCSVTNGGVTYTCLAGKDTNIGRVNFGSTLYFN